MYLMKCMKFLLINSLLLNGQLPFLITDSDYLFRSLVFRTRKIVYGCVSQTFLFLENFCILKISLNPHILAGIYIYIHIYIYIVSG